MIGVEAKYINISMIEDTSIPCPSIYVTFVNEPPL